MQFLSYDWIFYMVVSVQLCTAPKNWVRPPIYSMLCLMKWLLLFVFQNRRIEIDWPISVTFKNFKNVISNYPAQINNFSFIDLIHEVHESRWKFNKTIKTIKIPLKYVHAGILEQWNFQVKNQSQTVKSDISEKSKTSKSDISETWL